MNEYSIDGSWYCWTKHLNNGHWILWKDDKKIASLMVQDYTDLMYP